MSILNMMKTFSITEHKAMVNMHGTEKNNLSNQVVTLENKY